MPDIKLLKNLINKTLSKIQNTDPKVWDLNLYQQLVRIYSHPAVHITQYFGSTLDSEFLLQRKNCIVAYLIVFLLNENMTSEQYQTVLQLMRQRYLIQRDLTFMRLPVTAPDGVCCIFSDTCSIEVLHRVVIEFKKVNQFITILVDFAG